MHVPVYVPFCFSKYRIGEEFSVQRFSGVVDMNVELACENEDQLKFVVDQEIYLLG